MEQTPSELSFAFAYTRELTTLWAAHVLGAPVWPTQHEVGKETGGYDLRLDSTIGFVYFAQFKRTHLLSRENAGQSGFGLPYCRVRQFYTYATTI